MAAEALQPRVRTLPGQRLVNLVIRGLLRTPGVSAIAGGRLLVLYLEGRKSGRRYSIPVAYLADGDSLLLGTSAGWKHNLYSGQTVTIRLRGRVRRADVTKYSDEAEVVSAYAHMARANPTFAGFNNIPLGEDGEPDKHRLRLAWCGGALAIRLTPR
jgi:hypothetical protein